MFGCHDNYVYCLSIINGPQILWKKNFDSPIFSTPFVSAGPLLSVVVVCSTKGMVNLLDVSDGAVIANCKLPGEIFSSPVLERNFIVVGCRDDYVYCFHLSSC